MRRGTVQWHCLCRGVLGLFHRAEDMTLSTSHGGVPKPAQGRPWAIAPQPQEHCIYVGRKYCAAVECVTTCEGVTMLVQGTCPWTTTTSTPSMERWSSYSTALTRCTTTTFWCVHVPPHFPVPLHRPVPSPVPSGCPVPCGCLWGGDSSFRNGNHGSRTRSRMLLHLRCWLRLLWHHTLAPVPPSVPHTAAWVLPLCPRPVAQVLGDVVLNHRCASCCSAQR